MKNIYSEMYVPGHLLTILPSYPRIKVMVSLANSLNLKNKKILDIGCHDGTFLSLLNDKLVVNAKLIPKPIFLMTSPPCLFPTILSI